MVPQKFFNKILKLEAVAIEWKNLATELRSELESFYSPAPKRGKKKVLSVQQEIELTTKRRLKIIKSNYINKI